MTQVNVNLTNNKISYHVNTTVIYSYTVRDIFHLRKKAKVKKNKKEVIQEPDFFSYLPGSHSGSNAFFLTCSILAFSRRLCTNLVRSLLSMRWCCWDIVSNPGSIAVRLARRAQIWPSVYQKPNAHTRKNTGGPDVVCVTE